MAEDLRLGGGFHLEEAFIAASLGGWQVWKACVRPLLGQDTELKGGSG